MFLGEYSHSLDAKGRLTIPARFRPQLDEGLIISAGQDPCLVIYPLREWQALAERLARVPRSQGSARSFTRLLFGRASEATLDKMGRVLIPSFLREQAGIDQDAVIVGMNAVIEVWSPEAYRARTAQDSESWPDIEAAMAELGV